MHAIDGVMNVTMARRRTVAINYGQAVGLKIIVLSGVKSVY